MPILPLRHVGNDRRQQRNVTMSCRCSQTAAATGQVNQTASPNTTYSLWYSFVLVLAELLVYILPHFLNTSSIIQGDYRRDKGSRIHGQHRVNNP
jgi:hypothetical protein